MNNLLEQLASLGMTEYEAKVYLSLLGENPATGYQVSKTSGVPRSMVYEALGRLEARGAVQKSLEEKVTLYQPVPPTMLLDRYEREARDWAAGLRAALLPLYNQEETGRLWNFSGRREALAYAADLIDAAKAELMLVLADADLNALHSYLEAAHARGVSLGVILTGSMPFELGQVVRHPKRETELHRMQETLIVVSDEREFLISSGHRIAAATVTTNVNMVLIARQFIWMELFAQRIFARLGDDLIQKLDPEDQQVLH